MGTRPTGTVTFLFTDIEGSTHLAQQYPDDLPRLLERHNEVLEQAIAAHNGFTFRTMGDGYCVAFHSANDALQAAFEAQLALQAEVWSPAPVKVRMGIHTGTAKFEEKSEGADYSGYVTLALVQRVMAAGHGGQILVSESAFDLAKNGFSENIYWKDMGEHELKGVLHPERLYQLAVPGLSTAFPALNTQKSRNHNLPVSLSSFIGRTRELAETVERIEGARMLSLIGPGGTGKTRLSIKIGAELLPAFQDGVWLVELAPLSDPALIIQTVASVFGLREGADRPLTDLVIDYLRGKQLLLILDNCEHLIDACARLTDTLLRNCPDLKILASSREALGINGETVYRVPSLSLPMDAHGAQDLESMLECEAVQLFVDRALAVNPGFQLTDRNVSSVAQICLRLDGIPLALELAAARARVLSVEQIAGRLDDRFRLLTGGSRTALPRQQTLQALIDWSYDLLTGPERLVFRRLAVFVGGWTLEAAEAVCSGDEIEVYEVLDLLTQLVDKSLVRVEQVNDSTRYSRLETIRQYARQKLLDSDEAMQMRQRHLDYFIQLSEWADENWFGPKLPEVERRLKSEFANFRAALAWALESQPENVIRLVSWVTFLALWLYQGYISEAREWSDSVVKRIEALPPVSGEAAKERARLLSRCWDYIAGTTMNQGDHLTSRAAAEKSVAYAREADDQALLAQSLGSLGIGALYSGDPETALSVAREAYSICKQMGLEREFMWVLNTLIHIHTVTGDIEKVQRYKEETRALQREVGYPLNPAVMERDLSEAAFERSDIQVALERAENALFLFEEKGDRYDHTFFLSEVAHRLRQQGELETGLRYYRRSILLWKEFGHRAAVAHQLECFAYIASAQGQHSRAVKLFGAAEALRVVSQSVRTPVEQEEFEDTKSKLQAQLEADEFDALWNEGCSFTMERAIQYALENTE